VYEPSVRSQTSLSPHATQKITWRLIFSGHKINTDLNNEFRIKTTGIKIHTPKRVIA